MTTVYVVTSGSYSDFDVEAVFSTKEKARTFVEATKNGHYDSVNDHIDEYELDVLMPAPGLFGFTVDMKRDGSTEGAQRGIGRHPAIVTYEPSWGGDYMRVACYAKDENHAIKIANEHRFALIANEQWPE